MEGGKARREMEDSAKKEVNQSDKKISNGYGEALVARAWS